MAIDPQTGRANRAAHANFEALCEGNQTTMSTSFRRFVGTFALVFAFVFTALAVTQYWFVGWRLHETTRDELWDEAESLDEDIAFRKGWDLAGYRRSTTAPNMYLFLSQTGTVIDTAGFIRGLVTRVSFPFAVEYDRPFRAKSDVGEEWLLYVHPVIGGSVVLGARADVLPENVEPLLKENVLRFGSTVAEALRVKERSIDESFDYAIIDSNGVLRESNSGIPFKTAAPQIPAKPRFIPIREIEGEPYASLEYPIFDSSRRAVGLVTVFKEVKEQERVLRETALFNIIVAAALWLTTVSALALYHRRVRAGEISCAQVPSIEEGENVEFKPSLRWDFLQQKVSKDVERANIKAVAGFLNSETGGTLLIGVGDQKQIHGLEADYRSFNSVRQDRDKFEQMLRETLIKAVGERLCAKCVKVRFCGLNGKDICLVRVAPASEAVYVGDHAGRPTMYVRIGNSTRPLDVREAVAYANERWGGPSLNWFHFRLATRRASA